MCKRTAERLNVADGLYTAAILREVGIGEGHVLSPLLFVFVIDEWLCELRASGIGASIPAVQ